MLDPGRVVGFDWDAGNTAKSAAKHGVSTAEAEQVLETHDTTEYFDWSKTQQARFPNLKPSTQAISLRLPLALLEQIKIEANRRDVPYQSLIKIWLAEKVQRKRRSRRFDTLHSGRV